MCGCSSRALVRASRTNRSASPGDGVSPRSSTFTATSWPRVSSRTRNTAAKPPSPKTSPTVNFLPRAFWRRRRSVTRSSDMADAKPRNLRRAALGTAGVVLVWLFAVWPPPVWWRDHWPRETAMMGEQAVGGSPSARPAVRPTNLESISPVLQRMVIIAEDSRFRSHVGIDLAEIADALGVDAAHGFWSAVGAAWRHRDRLRGASTITQQLAKNLYLSSSRNPIRKVKEAVTALQLELALSKDRILELYLNVAEWGPGIWGVDAACRAYFAVPAARLTAEQAAELAATLPPPRTSNPTFRPERMLTRRNLILARYRGVDVYIPPEEETDTIPVPTVLLPPVDSLQIDSLPPVDSTQDSLTTRRTDAQMTRRTDATDAQRRTVDSSRDSLP